MRFPLRFFIGGIKEDFSDSINCMSNFAKFAISNIKWVVSQNLMGDALMGGSNTAPNRSVDRCIK